MNQRGFTLIELLVASAILALLGALTANLLIGALDSEQRLARAGDQLSRVGNGIATLRRDLEQAIDRPSRDDRGDLRRASLIGGVGDDNVFLQFSHAGRRQFPGRIGGSELAHIRYLFQDGDWIRMSYPYTDPAPTAEWQSRRLFSDIENLQLGFFDGGSWHRSWPPVDSDSAELPQAVRLQFDGNGYEDIELVVLLPGAKS